MIASGGSKDSILEIVEDIKARICSRLLLPDVRINQNQIAKELNVSRTPVIKALHMLQSEGLVVNVPNKGFYVHKASLQDTVELYELRQAVEMVAVVCAAEYASTADLVSLRHYFAPFIGMTEIDRAAYAEADRLFHSRLIELSGNRILQRTNLSILILPKAFSSGLLRSPADTLQEHIDMAEAIIQRDAELSSQLAQKHLKLTLQTLKAAVASLRLIGADPRKIALEDIALTAKSMLTQLPTATDNKLTKQRNCQ